MKKILLATTVLAATAGYASADIKLTGSANMGVKYNEDRDNSTYLWNELDFNVIGSGTTDSGIEFGASVSMDSHSDDGTTIDDNSGTFDPIAYISSGGLTIKIGDVYPATDDFGISDIGFDGIGIDDIAEAAWDEGSANLLVTYTIGDTTFYASADGTDGDDWAVAVMGEIAGFGYGLGYEENEESGVVTDITLAQVSYSFGDASLAAVYVSGDYDSYGIQADYKMGDLGLRAVMGWADNALDQTSYGIGASYDLGSGLAVAGGVGSADGTTTADFGVTMKF